MNSSLKNLKVIKCIPNYYKIIEEEFSESDAISGKLIQIYEELVEETNPEDKSEIKILTSFAKVIERFFNDGEFKKELSILIVGIKVKSNIDNIVKYIATELIKAYDKYLDGYTRNLYIPRCI